MRNCDSFTKQTRFQISITMLGVGQSLTWMHSICPSNPAAAQRLQTCLELGLFGQTDQWEMKGSASTQGGDFPAERAWGPQKERHVHRSYQRVCVIDVR